MSFKVAVTLRVTIIRTKPHADAFYAERENRDKPTPLLVFYDRRAAYEFGERRGRTSLGE